MYFIHSEQLSSFALCNLHQAIQPPQMLLYQNCTKFIYHLHS